MLACQRQLADIVEDFLFLLYNWILYCFDSMHLGISEGCEIKILVCKRQVPLLALIQSGASRIHYDTGRAYRDKDGTNSRALSSHCCCQLMTPQDTHLAKVLINGIDRDRQRI